MKSTGIERREWLKKAGLTLAGLSILPSMSLNARSIHNPYTGQWLYEPVRGKIKARLWRNENPYGPSEKARQRVIDALPESNRYAFESIQELKSQIATMHGLRPENVMITAGSSEILIFGGIAVAAGKGNIVTAHPTFDTIMATATHLGADWIQVPLTSKQEHDLPAMEAAINSETRLVYICNPNNPTGSLTPPDRLKTFCRRVSKKVPVMVDEAYTEFMSDGEKHSMIPLINEGHDIIVAKTLSKIHGFAGLRIGYALGTKKSIQRLQDYSQWPVTPSGPAVEAAKATLEDNEFMDFCRNKNAEAKEMAYHSIQRSGLIEIRSYTSFVLFNIPYSPSEFLPKMEAQGVGLRGWSFADKHWCRVSMGTPEDMEMFGKALKKAL